MNNAEHNRVAEFYGSIENRLWDRLTGGHIHLGYWDEQNRDAGLAEAALRLTQVMIDMTAVGPGQRFIDIGCGLGIPAMQLARTRGCQVEGITISPYQQQEAARRAAEAGMAAQAHFLVANALELPFADGSFGGGWFFESIFHMGHLPALREASRVLKPDAELLVADVVDIGRMSEEAARLAWDLCNARYVPTSAYPELLDAAGFELLELRDVTEQVLVPLDARFRSAVAARYEEFLEFADTATLDGFAEIGSQLAGTAGYALIRARRR